MLEIFDLPTDESSLVSLWKDQGVGVWGAGADLGALPADFSQLEVHLFLRTGRLRVGTTTLECPSLAFWPQGELPRFECLDSRLRVFLWVVYASAGGGPARGRRLLLGPADLATPRTVTASTSIVHWLPRSASAERRTLAGNPSLALNLGRSPIPMVSGEELVPLAGDHGAVVHDVVTMRTIPQSGPILAVERIVPG